MADNENENECRENGHVLYLVSESDTQYVYRCQRCGKLIVEKRD